MERACARHPQASGDFHSRHVDASASDRLRCGEELLGRPALAASPAGARRCGGIRPCGRLCDGAPSRFRPAVRRAVGEDDRAFRASGICVVRSLSPRHADVSVTAFRVARGECCDEPNVRIRPLSWPKLFRAFGKPRREVFRRFVGSVIPRRSLSSARLRACFRPRSSLRVSSDEYPFGMLGFPSVFRAKVRVAAFPVFRCSRSFVSAVRGCLSFLPKFRRFPFGSVAGRRSHALCSPGPVAVPSSRTGWSAAGRGRSEPTAAFPCRIVPSGKKTGGGPSGPSPVGSMRFSRFRASNPGGIDSADACRLPGRP